MMITCHTYTGPSEAKVPVIKIQHMTRSETFAKKDSYVVHFADKQCQDESLVGGKGYSLAILTSITTNDARIYDILFITRVE